MPRRDGSSSAMISIARIFGAPETVPAGKHATSASRRSLSSASSALDARHQVHHVRVALDRHELRHAHGAVVADAAESLRPRSTSMTCSARSFSSRFSSSPSRWSSSWRARRAAACRRSGGSRRAVPRRRTSISGDAPTIDSVAEAQEEHVRRRVDVPQRAVDVNGSAVTSDVEALRQHHLIDVAGRDVLLGLRDRRLELPRASCAPRRSAARRRRSRPARARRSSSRSRKSIFAQANW